MGAERSKNHHEGFRAGNVPSKIDAKLISAGAFRQAKPSTDAVIGGFARNHYVVGMTFFDAGVGNSYELSLL